MKLWRTVEDCLRDYPVSRSNEPELLMRVWEQYGLVLTPDQRSILKTMPRPESITRCRRKIQETRYQATAEVKQVRDTKAEVIKSNIRTTPVEQVDTLFDASAYDVRR